MHWIDCLERQSKSWIGIVWMIAGAIVSFVGINFWVGGFDAHYDPLERLAAVLGGMVGMILFAVLRDVVWTSRR